LRNRLSGGKQKRTWWPVMLQPPISNHPAAPLLVSGSAEQAFGDALQTVIAVPSGGGKVIYYQQRVLGMECQRLQGIRRGSEITGKMRRVHSRSEVLLGECGQGGFEYSSLPNEKHAEIDFAEGRPIYGREQREADSVGREGQAK
jgi:hypothetical protein